MSLSINQSGRVLRLTLNRPDKRNALDHTMAARLVDAVEAAQTDDSVGVFLIDATGAAFCAGMDLDEAASQDGVARTDIHDRLFSLGHTSTKPIVVSVNGLALGGGVGIVAQGHVVVASERAVFGFPEIRIGLWPFMIYRSLEEKIGRSRMMELSLTGRMFYTAEATAWGLVHSVINDDELEDQALAFAQGIANASPLAHKAGLEYWRRSRGLSLAETSTLAQQLRSAIMTSDDFREGVAAFKQKREPKWPSMTT